MPLRSPRNAHHRSTRPCKLQQLFPRGEWRLDNARYVCLCHYNLRGYLSGFAARSSLERCASYWARPPRTITGAHPDTLFLCRQLAHSFHLYLSITSIPCPLPPRLVHDYNRCSSLSNRPLNARIHKHPSNSSTTPSSSESTLPFSPSIVQDADASILSASTAHGDSL